MCVWWKRDGIAFFRVGYVVPARTATATSFSSCPIVVLNRLHGQAPQNDRHV